MTNNHKLMKNTLLYTVTHFGSSILSFLMLPIYTFYFNPSEFGTWDLVMTTIALLSPLITLELVSATYRWLLDAKTKNEQITIISTGIISIGRSLLLINSLVIIIIILRLVEIPYIWETLLLINVSIVSSFTQQCARGLQHNVLFAISGIIQSIIIVSLNLLLMFVFHLRIEAFFYSTIIAHLGTIIFLFIRMKFNTYLRIQHYSKQIMKQFLTYSLPIVPGAISWWVMTVSDRYMIIYFLGLKYNGIFALANKVPAILLMVNNIFFLAWKDQAITEFNSKEKNSYYSYVFKHFSRIVVSALILLTLLTKLILTLFFSADYFTAWQYVGLLLVGSLFHTFSLFWSAGYHGAKKTNVIFVTSVVGALINIVINFLFIPVIGLYAVGLSTTIAFLFTWIVRIIYAKPYFNITINYRETLILFALIIIVNIIPFIVSSITLIIISCFAFIFIVILNYPFLSENYKTIKHLVKN